VTGLINLLLVAIATLLFARSYPEAAREAILPAAIVVGVLIPWNWYRTRWQEYVADIEKRREEMRERNEFSDALQAIRAKFDPDKKWNEGTSPPIEYLEEVTELRRRYITMLRRVYGPDEVPEVGLVRYGASSRKDQA
jgi:hypothetical protein